MCSVQSFSRVWLFATLWTTAHQASLSITNSRSLPKPMSIELVMPSNHVILCRPLLLLPSTFPSIRVFSNESALPIRWPEYWSFSFNIGPSNEHPGLISFRMDWVDLPAVQETLKSLLQHHSSKASIFQCSAFFIVQLSHPYMTTGKTIDLTRQTFADKVMSLLFNMLSRLVITFLPRSKRFLISWLQSPSAVILEPRKIKSDTFHCFPIYFPWSDGTRCHDLSSLNVELYANFSTLLSHFHQEALQFLFTFCHQGGVICIWCHLRLLIFLPAEVIDISSSNLDSSLCFLQPSISDKHKNIIDSAVIKLVHGTFLEVQWLRLHLSMQGVWVQSLVGEQRSHIPHGQRNQNIKQKKYCNKFNKDFKNGPSQKNKLSSPRWIWLLI